MLSNDIKCIKLYSLFFIILWDLFRSLVINLNWFLLFGTFAFANIASPRGLEPLLPPWKGSVLTATLWRQKFSGAYIIWQKIIRKYSKSLYAYFFNLSRDGSPTITPNKIMNIISMKLLYWIIKLLYWKCGRLILFGIFLFVNSERIGWLKCRSPYHSWYR